MNKILYVIIVLLIILLIVTNYKSSSTIINNADSVKIINDSIHEIIKESEVRIVEINKEYEKKLIDIDTQSVYSDALFFSNYLSKDSI